MKEISINSKHITRKRFDSGLTSRNYLTLKDNCSLIENTQRSKEFSKYIPICFGAVIRTTYTNEVLTLVEGGSVVPFIFNTPLETKSLEDHCAYASKMVTEQVFKDASLFSRMIEHTAFYPVGAMYLDGKVIVISHVILDDEVLDKFKSNLKEGFEFQPIVQGKLSDNSISDIAYQGLHIVKAANPEFLGDF